MGSQNLLRGVIFRLAKLLKFLGFAADQKHFLLHKHTSHGFAGAITGPVLTEATYTDGDFYPEHLGRMTLMVGRGHAEELIFLTAKLF